MPFQIQVPGKGIAEFPDEVSYDDAFRSIQEDVPDFQPSRADVFAQLKSKSDAFAAPDRARYAGQLGVTDKPSGFDYLASSAANYAGQMGGSVPGALGVLGGVQEGLGLGNSINERVRKPVQNFIDDTFTVDPETTTGLKGLLTTGVAGGMGQLHGQLLLSKAIKVPPKAANAISSLAGGAQEFTDAWDRERERQNQAGEDDPLKALIKSGGYAAIATILESKLGPGHLAEKLAELGKGKVNNIIASAFKNAASGGAEEFLQRIAQNLIIDTTEVSKEDQQKLGFSWWKSVDVPSALSEGLVGAIVQGGAGTSIDALNNRAVAQNDKQKAVFEEKYSNFLAQEAKRSNADATREQSANELAQMVGFDKPHVEPKLPLPTPQRFAIDQDAATRDALSKANAFLAKQPATTEAQPPPLPIRGAPQAQPAAVASTPVATPVAQPQIQNEVQLLKQAEDARQAGQISDQEYLIAVDRFQRARAVESAQPPPLPAPQTPNPLGGELTNEGQIQKEGLLTQPATPPLSQSAEGVVQPAPVTAQPQATPQAQPSTTPTVTLESNPPDKIDAPVVSETKVVPEKRFKEGRVVTPESLPNSTKANSTEWFHGGKQGITEPSSSFTAIDSLFGSGFYLTDDPEIAHSYTKNRGGSNGALYSVKVNVGNVLNLESPITPDVANALKASIGSEFSGVVDNGLNKGSSTGSVIRGIQEAFAEHSAENGYPKSEYVEYWNAIENKLREAGYDAMTHIGGSRVGKGKKLHQVLILLDPSAELSSRDNPYKKTVGSIDRIDAALSRAIEATNPFGKSNTGNLGVTYTVLKLTRAAYRAGKSLAIAIKESIAQYRAANPTAQFNDAEVDAGVRIKLQDFLSGGEDALAIAKAAEPAVAENERAAAMIHSEEYYRQRVRDKETELKKIKDDALQAAIGRGVDPSMVPDDHMDAELANMADGLGLDAALVTQLQTEVKNEKKAFVLSKLQGEVEEINRTIDKLAKLDPDKNVQVVEDLLKRKDSLHNEIVDEKFDDVRVRAAFILDFQREYVSRKARLEALNNPDVKEAISGPVQVLRDLLAEYPDIRNRGVSAWVSDSNITDDVKRVVVARLSTAFREFDARHDNVATTLASSEAALERQINRLKERISSGEIRKAYINIVIEEARLALAGEEGLTGGRGAEYLAWFDANTEALRSFARAIAEKVDGTGQSALDARKLADWLIFSPSSAPPAIVNSARENWGVGDETLREIMKVLQESDATRNAVAAIFDKGSETIPAHTLQRIAELANTGEESDSELADNLAKRLQKKQGTEKAKVVQRLRTDAKNLLDARIRLETLREALKLFKNVEASPVFKDARIETETEEGSFTRQMFVGDEKTMTLRGFSGPEINQPEINIGGRSSFGPDTKKAIESWRRSAAQYISMYDIAQTESDMNPLAPHPITLGFDQAVYRGLQNALEENNVLIDPSTHDDGSRIDDYHGLTKNGQSFDFTRQTDAVARMVEGVFGKNWQQKNRRYRDSKLDSIKVFHNPENAKIPALLSKAMASHPKIGGAAWLKAIPKFGTWFNENFAPGGNVDVYRKRVFDQIAHAARGNFVDSPKVGDVLPSGEVVTQADLDLVDQAIKYSVGLLNVAQKNRGTLMNIGKREFRRPAASVGVRGMARHIGVYGNAFANALLEAFKANKDAGAFAAGEDLTNGMNLWVQFWNVKALHDDVLTHHVLDSVRGDRAITVSPYMRTAYEGLAASMIAEKYANRISNLEDLVAKLSVHFPTGTGFNAREYIIGELGKELSQYVAHAKTRQDSIEKAELALNPISSNPDDSKDLRKKSSSIVESETMNNEFTKPAADLIFPSVYYEYGAITPTEMALAKDRATSESVIEMKHAMREAYAALYSYKISIDKLADTDPVVKDERDRVDFVMKQIHNLDLDIGRDLREINAIWKAARGGISILIGSALTAPAAAIGNVVSSGLPAYIFASRVSRLNKLSLTMLAMKQSARATKNLAYVYIDKAVGGYASSAFNALSKSKNPAMVKVADSITSLMDRGMKWAGFMDAAGVKSLGLSQTDRFITEVFNDVRGVLQYVDSDEESKYSGVLGKTRLTGKAAAKITASTMRNFSKQVGLESGDLAVNMAAMSISDFMERDLKKMAKAWATDRIAKFGDKFDESSKDWEVRPDEYYGGWFASDVAQQSRLAGLRVAMSESGTQLENALWDYWNRSEGGKLKNVEFFKDPASFHRIVIGAVNANIYTNRPQKAQTNPEQSMLQTLMNYTSDLAVKVMGAMKSVKSAKGMKKWFEILMRAVWGAIAALLVGIATGASRELVNRKFASKIGREMTPLDKEFWIPDENLPKRLATYAAFVMPGGQSFVNLMSLGRPDAASGNFWVSALNSVTAFLMGAMRIQSQDLTWLAKRALIKHFPFMEVILSNTSVNDTRQIGSGVNAYASAAKMAGIDRQNDAANAAGQQFTEKTPILAKINEAGMRAQVAREKGDSDALAEAKADLEREKDRLIKFHKDALVKDNKRRGITMSDFKVDQEAIAAARKDWMSLNPITKVLGHQPTENEMERMSAYLSGDRKDAAARAWNSYSGMAEYFPDGKGVTTEPNQTRKEKLGGIARSSGGGLGISSASGLSASLRGGGLSGGIRASGGSRSRGSVRLSRMSRGLSRLRRGRSSVRRTRRVRF